MTEIPHSQSIVVAKNDPATMTPEERFLEIAMILAGAYVRLKVGRKESHNSLEVMGEDTALCA